MSLQWRTYGAAEYQILPGGYNFSLRVPLGIRTSRITANYLFYFSRDEESRPSTPNISTDLNTSNLVPRGKHVHFAPDLNSILSELEEDGVLGFLQQQRDLSADIRLELEHSLTRLRVEAQELLDLSAKLTKGRNDSKMLESSQVQITELVQELDAQQRCDNCEMHRKTMEEAMSECLQRENLLRSDLEAAMMKIAHLMTVADGVNSTDLIAEGYGTGQLQPGSLGPRARPPPDRGAPPPTPPPPSPPSPASTPSPAARLAKDLDLLQRERDDLHQQLEAANRQLRSTRQFVEEQATEREAERDEFAKRLADLRDENSRLATRLQNNARIINEMQHRHARGRAHHHHVEQLETQTREMNQIINDLETKKAASDEELKATEEKITLLRDIIGNLENQLEQKTAHEAEILQQLEEMRKTIDERDGRLRSLLGELESMKTEKADQTEVTCVQCGQEEDRYAELLEKVQEQIAC
ncbi:rootletin-like [Achroia grisella]|uniref:rootletin-like n=1 Tax=Achroia grisella TaxID=688607 RepID=UPI0027D30373|nr:rootletin-like [Achroia grisella]